MGQNCLCMMTLLNLHDFCFRAVRPFREDFDAPQIVWRDDPRLHLQAPAVCVVVPADWRHTCHQQTFSQNIDFTGLSGQKSHLGFSFLADFGCFKVWNIL